MTIDDFAFQRWLLQAENKEDTIISKDGNVAV